METERTQLTLAELGKTLLIKAQEGDTEQVRELMAKGAPFTTDWVSFNARHANVFCFCLYVYIY